MRCSVCGKRHSDTVFCHEPAKSSLSENQILLYFMFQEVGYWMAHRPKWLRGLLEFMLFPVRIVLVIDGFLEITVDVIRDVPSLPRLLWKPYNEV